MKCCTKCGEEKPLDAFTPNSRASLGVNNWCRVCYNAYGAAYYAKTRERRRAKARARRAESAEKYNAKGKAWREANPDYYRDRYIAAREDVCDRATRRYRANPEASIRAACEWAKRNPERANATNARHHAKMRSAPGRGISGGEWAAVLNDSLGLCVYCNERKKLSLDHIDPLALGGAHDTDNAAAACRSCNSSKRQQRLVVWLARRARRAAA